MNNIEKLAERDDDTKMLGNVSTDELEQMAKTHPRSALTIAYSEGIITGIKRAKAYAQLQTEPVARLIADPMLLPALKAPYIDWKVDPITLELDTDLFTHPPATVPEGYALVPIEPTNEMLDALADTLTGENEGCSNVPYYKDAYKAMLSASPTPPNAVPLEKYNKLLDALRFYADKNHVNFGDNLNKNFPNVFAMKYVPISGGEYPACIENGEVARQAIAEAEGKKG